ncbi:MAG TPA: hypothetical protein VNL14_13790 [Candidatus Acidoferrales bacterium]|nr:hypothetical protein [Candidatus Acidoferrales bacterium]
MIVLGAVLLGMLLTISGLTLGILYVVALVVGIARLGAIVEKAFRKAQVRSLAAREVRER